MLSESGQNAEVSTALEKEKTLDQLMAECNFTAEELRTVDAYASQIDVMDNNEILEYGVGCQKKLTDFSETALNNVKTKDLGEVGDMLTDVIAEWKKRRACLDYSEKQRTAWKH